MGKKWGNKQARARKIFKTHPEYVTQQTHHPFSFSFRSYAFTLEMCMQCSIALQPNSYTWRHRCPVSPSPWQAAPLTSLSTLPGSSTLNGCPVQAGAWASLPHLLWKPSTQKKRRRSGDSPCTTREWSAAGLGGAEKPGLLLGLDSQWCRTIQPAHADLWVR